MAHKKRGPDLHYGRKFEVRREKTDFKIRRINIIWSLKAQLMVLATFLLLT